MALKRILTSLMLAAFCGLSAVAHAAGEIAATDATGQTLYAVIKSGIQPWNGTTFGTYSDANWSTYAVLLSEQGTSGQYVATFPAGIVTAGRYQVYIYEESVSGTVSLLSDTLVAQGPIEWTGSKQAGIATLPSDLFATSYLSIPADHSTSNTAFTLTYKQWMVLQDAVSGGDNTTSGPPVASGTASVTYYLRGAPKTSGNVVAVATVTYDSNKNQTGRSVVVKQPFPVVN